MNVKDAIIVQSPLFVFNFPQFHLHRTKTKTDGKDASASVGYVLRLFNGFFLTEENIVFLDFGGTSLSSYLFNFFAAPQKNRKQ